VAHLNSAAPAICVAIEEFESLTEEWNELLERCGLASPFLRPAWLRVWLDTFAPDADLIVLGVRDGEQLIGLMPLLRRGDELLLAGDSEICDYADIISSEDMRAVVLDALLSHLDGLSWRRLTLWGIRADSPTLAELDAAASRSGISLELELEAECPRVALPATWDEYLLSLSKKDRHELRRKIRRLGESGEVREYALTDPVEVSAAMPDFLRLHTISRQDKAEFMTADMERFFVKMATTLAEEDSIRLYFLELDGQRVASVLAFNCGEELWLYNSGFDPDFASVSVGLVSKAMALRQAIAEGRSCYDFLRGSEPYKYDLGAEDLDVFRCTLTRDGPTDFESGHSNDC
jgi:CelD/BcsL family acetyltransferase involved in cellulose biosynthesis